VPIRTMPQVMARRVMDASHSSGKRPLRIARLSFSSAAGGV
jgi:hypothetical protein